ncbi:hypothetical protein V6N12_055312, partial [Hibiscus sabdariffa]
EITHSSNKGRESSWLVQGMHEVVVPSLKDVEEKSGGPLHEPRPFMLAWRSLKGGLAGVRKT